jgi:hypothetical protein
MKKGLALLIIFILSTSLVYAADPKGYVDYAGCDTFSGWSCDADSYSTPLTIHFYADGTASTGRFVGSTVAGNIREAAVGTQCGGNVNHGFSFTAPAILKDGLSHTIYAYAINTPGGTNPMLTNSPKTITCLESGVEYMTGRFLGTGYPNHDSWTVYGRQLSSALINNDTVIDFSCWTELAGNKGTCGVARLNQYGINKNSINYLLITHHHEDHCDPSQIVALAESRTSPTKLTVYGGVEVVDRVNTYLGSVGKTGLVNVIHLSPYVQTAMGPYTVTPLIAYHDYPENEPYVYVIGYKGKNFIYAQDSGTLEGASLSYIYGTKLDLVVRERGFDVYPAGSDKKHMDAAAVAAERADWISHSVIKENTTYLLTHLAYCALGSCLVPSRTRDLGDGSRFYMALSTSTSTIMSTSSSTTTTSSTTSTSTTTSSTTSSSTSTSTTTSSSTSSTTTTTSTSTTSTSTTTSVSSSSTTTTTAATTTSTTTTTIASPQCVMPGNDPPCDVVSLSEAVDGIYEWVEGNMGLGEVIDLINSWADPAGHPPD